MVSGQYEFGAYRLDAQGRMLFREGARVALPPKVAELLVALVQAAGTVVTREHLLERLWPDTVVEEGSLTSHISLLRKTLGRDSNGGEFIETLSKRGYRFVAHVTLAESEAPESVVSRVMLVVLPFENFTTGDKYDYFSDGLTEEMITEIARLSPERLGVIARTSAMQFKSTTKSIGQIGHELGISHVLEGSVRRAGERVRITAQLIRVSDESHLWAQSYERALDDVLEVQAEVAQAVAREVQVKLSPRDARRLHPEKKRSIKPQAYEAYLRGRHFWYRRTEEGMRKSIECFQAALQHDPSFAAAYDGISDAHTMLACRGMTPALDSFHKAKAAARQAVRIEPDLGEGYASLAHVRLHDWDWVGIENDFKRAVELDPGYAIAHYWYAEYLMAMGRTGEAVRRVEHSLVLDPLNSVINASVGMIRYLAHDYDGALVALRRGLEIDPTHYVSHLRVGLVCLQKKLPNEAVAAMLQAVTHSGGSTEALVGLAQAYAVVGDSQTMKRIVQELGEGRRPYVSPYNVARLYGAVDDKQRALEWLERAYEEHNPDLIELTREPSFASLRSDAKFRELAARIGWNSVAAAR
ncbi:MAG TPA: winged helix-turn-helix domain-containing protein [Steroidobacteraceae bacterium]|nr:winged helix-turn-helix domain-containing protein [Steroidobacteraceae bacterium]